MRTRVVVPALTVALALAGLLAPGASLAACTGAGAFTCTVTVSVATPLAFGSYNPAIATPTDNTTVITVVGTVSGLLALLVNVSYTISLDAGSSSNITNRQLVGPVSTTPLAYNLYTTNARTTTWGLNSITDNYNITASIGGTTVSRPYTVYGRIPIGQYVAPGSYSDTITVTVTY